MTYSGNVKAGDRAGYRITFKGNYKGRRAVSGKFTIKKARFGSGIYAKGLNKAYTGPGKYTGPIYVYTFLNNVDKGTALIIVNGETYYGTGAIRGRTASFRIGQRGMSGFLQSFFK